MCGTDNFCAYHSPSHLTNCGGLLSCPSPTLFWETEKRNSVKTCIRIHLLQAEGFYKQLEMYATFLSEGHNSLKYFYSQTALPSPHVCLVFKCSKPQELLHPFRSRAVGSWICRNHLFISSSPPSVTQRNCQSLHTLPSFLSSLLFPHQVGYAGTFRMGASPAAQQEGAALCAAAQRHKCVLPVVRSKKILFRR